MEHRISASLRLRHRSNVRVDHLGNYLLETRGHAPPQRQFGLGRVGDGCPGFGGAHKTRIRNHVVFPALADIPISDRAQPSSNSANSTPSCPVMPVISASFFLCLLDMAIECNFDRYRHHADPTIIFRHSIRRGEDRRR